MAILEDVTDATAAVSAWILKVFTWAALLGLLGALFGPEITLASPAVWALAAFYLFFVASAGRAFYWLGKRGERLLDLAGHASWARTRVRRLLLAGVALTALAGGAVFAFLMMHAVVVVVEEIVQATAGLHARP